MKTKIIQNIKSIILALILIAGVGVVSATSTWNNPTATPPGNNVDTPINAGTTAQAKNGSLTLGASTPASDTGSSYSLQVLNKYALFKAITTQALNVTTSLTLPTGAANGNVLTSDASGVATWQPPATGTVCPVVTPPHRYSVKSFYNVFRLVPQPPLPPSMDIYNSNGTYRTVTPWGHLPGGWAISSDDISANKVCSTIFPDAPYVESKGALGWNSPQDNHNVRWSTSENHWIVVGGGTPGNSHLGNTLKCTAVISTTDYNTLLY